MLQTYILPSTSEFANIRILHKVDLCELSICVVVEILLNISCTACGTSPTDFQRFLCKQTLIHKVLNSKNCISFTEPMGTNYVSLKKFHFQNCTCKKILIEPYSYLVLQKTFDYIAILYASYNRRQHYMSRQHVRTQNISQFQQEE